MNNNNSKVKIYFDSPKSYFNPGETFSASIKLDVLEQVNSNKILIIAKGKKIIKATQNRLLLIADDYSDEDNLDFEEGESESDFDSTFRDNSDEIYSTNSKDQLTKRKGIIDIDESKEIFKYKRVVHITENDFLSKGVYAFPIVFELPDDLPGSFLFLESNAYVEVIYTIKVKLNNIDVKQSFPFIVRQEEKIFNYPKSSDYEKNIKGCCCEVISTKIKINLKDKYILDENEIKINVILDNSKCKLAGSPIIIEIYQELMLYPLDRSNKIKITKIVGKFIDENPIEAKKDYNLDITIPLEMSLYTQEKMPQTKAYKYFKNKNVIPLLGQSLKSETILSKYEIYVESKFSNVSIDDLGVFASAIIYPPEKGIFPRYEENKNVTEITNKTVYLNKKNLAMDEDSDFEKDKNKVGENANVNVNKDKDKNDDKVKINKAKTSFINSNEESSSLSIKKENDSNKEKNNNSNSISNSNENENSINIKDDENKKNNNDKVKHKLSFESLNNDKNNYSITDYGTSSNIRKNLDHSFLDDALDNVILNTDSTK